MTRGLFLVCAVLVATLFAMDASAIVYVDKAATGSGTGTSWANAYTTIQAGINRSLALGGGAANQVWVKAGNYNEARTELWGGYAGSLVMKNNVQLYGGFDGTETALSERGVRRAASIINGSISRAGSPAYHVVVFGSQSAPTTGAILDGFDITGGNAAGDGTTTGYHTWRGGGIYVWRSSPTIENCTIYGNTAAVSGGGASNESWSPASEFASPTYVNCVFYNNTASRGADTFVPTTDFGYDGVGLGTAPNPIRGGGAMFNNDQASAILAHCTIDGNVINTTWTAWGSNSGGIYQWRSVPLVSNSILWGDTGGEVKNDNPATSSYTATVTYSNVAGGYTGTGNLSTDPLFAASPAPPEFWLQSGSPCRDSGLSSFTRDLPGVTRPVNGTVDRGAYEYCATLPTAVCTPATVNLSSPTLLASAIDGGSTAGCGLWRLTAGQTTFTCSDGPSKSVSLTVTDLLGRTASCNATVTVVDDIDPVAAAKNITVYLNAAGTVSITGSNVDNGSTDNCGIQSLSVLPNTFGCLNTGPNGVTLTATDTSGNTDTAPATVTVVDNVLPTALCKPATVTLNSSLPAGSASITWTDIDNGSSDACGILSRVPSQTTFTSADVPSKSVTLTVTDNKGNVNTCNATVTVLCTAPVINDIPDVTRTDFTNYTSPAPTLLQGTPPITWSLVAPATPPANFSFNATTGTISWNPVLWSAGPLTVTIRGTNPCGASDDETFVITVDAVNPTITGIADATVNDGDAYTGPVPTFSGNYTGPITWQLVLPATPPANFQMLPTGQVTWTPAAYAASPVSVRIRARGPEYPGDPNNYDDEDWTITVTDLAPVITDITNVTVTDRANYTSVTPSVSGTGPFTWSLVTPATPPANFSINTGTGVVTWTPASYADAGTVAPLGAPQVDVVIQATGPGGKTDTEPWRITVDAIPPVITAIPDATPVHGTAYDSGVPTFVDPQPTTPIGWTLVSPATPPANFSMAGNGRVTWDPVVYSASPVSVIIRAQGPDGDQDDEDWTITVTAVAPVINPIADVHVNDESTYSVTPTLSAGTLPVTWTLEAPALAPANFGINGLTGEVTWDPVDYDDSPVSVTIRATGPATTFDEEEWTITVDPVAPTIVPIADAYAIHNDPYQAIPAATGTPYGTGFFGWSLIAGPSGMTIDADTGQVDWTADIADNGVTVTIQADGPGGDDQESWIIHVDPIPVPPEFDAVSDQTITDRAAYSFTPTLSAGTQPLTYKLLAPSPALGDMAINASTGEVTWTASYAQALTVAPLGAPAVDITLGVGNPTYPDNDTVTYRLTVDAIAPVIAGIADANPVDLSSYSSGVPIFVNPQPTLPIVWSLTSPATPPANFGINTATGEVTWNPVSYAAGPIIGVVIRATGPDGDLDEEDWTITVDAIPPVINAIGPANPVDGTNYSEVPSLSQGTGPIAWTLVAPGTPPANFGINATTGEVTWTPVNYQPTPIVNVTIRATGPDGDWDEEDWTITVDAVAPAITPIADATVPDGQNYDGVTPSLTAGTLPVIWTLKTPSPAPSGMSIDGNGKVTWNPSSYAVAKTFAPLTEPKVNIVIEAEGPDGDKAEEDWVLTVDAIAPVINDITDKTIVDKANFTSVTPGLSQGTLPVTWSLVAPVGLTNMSINTGTGVVTWTPISYADSLTVAPLGEPKVALTIRATGPDGDTDDETWVLTVDAIAPVIGAWTPTATVVDGQAYASTVPPVTGTEPFAWTLLLPSPAPTDMVADAGTGEVTWTADYAFGPVLTVQIQVEGPDGDQATRSWTVTVIPVPPIINPIGDDTVADGALYTSVLPSPLLSQGTVPVSYSLSTPSPLLAGMSVNSGTGVVTWTAANYTTAYNTPPLGVPQVLLTLKGEGPEDNTDEEDWLLTVDAVAPAIAPIADTSVMDGTAYTQLPSATGTRYPTTGFFAWTLVAGPAGMTINADTGRVNWAALYTDGTTPETVTIQAQGPDGDTGQETWTVLVYAEPPVIAEIATRWAVDSSVYAEAPSATGTQPFTWSLLQPDPVPGDMAIDPGTGAITWTADIGESPLSMVVQVEGPDGDTDTESWTLIVTATAEAPIINPIGAQLVVDGDAYSIIPVLSQGTGPFVWGITSPDPLPGNMAINAITGQITWTADYAAGPEVFMEVSCTNFVGADTEDWTLTVAAIPPVIDAMPDANPVDGTTFTSVAPTLTQGTLPIAWSLVAPASPPVGMSINTSTGVVTWNPTLYAAGPVVGVTIQAMGPDGDTDQTSYTITVDAVPPVIVDITNTSVFDGDIYTSVTPVLSAGTGPIVWSLLTPSPAPAHFSINASTGVVTWSPSLYAAGPVVNVQIQAAGPDGDVDTENWQITVIPVAPDINPIADADVDDQSVYTETPTLAQGTAPIAWTLLAPDPAPAGFSMHPSGVVTWNPANYEDGPVVSVTIRAQGPVGADTESWDVTVNPLVPVIGAIPDATVVDGTVHSVTPVLLQGSGTITWSIEAPTVLPGDMEIDPVTGVFTWTADISESPVDVSIQAAGPLDKDTEEWRITVVAVPVAPVITEVADAVVADGTVYSKTLTLDSGSTPVTWALLAPDPAVGDMALDPSTGELTWTAAIADSPLTITVQATNMAGPDEETWQLTVVPPLSFVSQPSGTYPLNVGEPISFEVEVTGGSGTRHYQWYKDGSPLLSAADDPVLAFAAVVMDDAGDYSCYVWDDTGAIISTSATLEVELGMPVAGLAGLALLASLVASAGVSVVRRRRK